MSRKGREPDFLPAARQDMADAFVWYERQSPGLGLEFLRSVEATIDSIQRHPRMYSVVLPDYRRALVRRFPYVVFYQIEPDRIVVYAVFHCSQDPGKWRARFMN